MNRLIQTQVYQQVIINCVWNWSTLFSRHGLSNSSELFYVQIHYFLACVYIAMCLCLATLTSLLHPACITQKWSKCSSSLRAELTHEDATDVGFYIKYKGVKMCIIHSATIPGIVHFSGPRWREMNKALLHVQQVFIICCLTKQCCTMLL